MKKITKILGILAITTLFLFIGTGTGTIETDSDEVSYKGLAFGEGVKAVNADALPPCCDPPEPG